MNIQNGFSHAFLSSEPDEFLLMRLKRILTLGSEMNSEL